jgi:uroporphyrinogen-III synthase
MTAAGAESRPWLVTRPGSAGSALSDALRAAGHDARWLPAFDIGAAPDAMVARTALAHLAEVDLAIFVSPAAVRAVHQLLDGRDWPVGTVIGAVGGATANAARALLARADGAPLTLIAPEAGPDRASTPAPDVTEGATADEPDAAAGSEAFWSALQGHLAARGAGSAALRRVLLLRAAQGRDWLLDQLRGQGVPVDPVAVYARRSRPWDASDVAWIAARLGGPPPRLVITSSEAVEALVRAAGLALPAALPWLQRGRALALHPRIVERLHASGFADAACVACTVDSLVAAA